MHRYNICPEKIETINTVRFDTRWKPKVSMEVAQDAEMAITSLQQDNPDAKVFTDRSGMDGKIGASAALYRNGRLKSTLRHQLGSMSHHTVYEGEGVGTLLGTHLINKEWGIWLAFIYINNQASIAATVLTKPKPGHHIFDMFHESITMLRKKHIGIKIKIKWIPGHKGVEGNEEADEQAKKAITDMGELPKFLRKKLPYTVDEITAIHSDEEYGPSSMLEEIHQAHHAATEEVSQHPNTAKNWPCAIS